MGSSDAAAEGAAAKSAPPPPPPSTTAKEDADPPPPPPSAKKKPALQHLVAGGAAGFVESSACHPLDTIKTRMQLRRQNTLRGRALGSLRDPQGGGKGSLQGGGGGEGRALRRTKEATTTGGAEAKRAEAGKAAAKTTGATAAEAKAKTETVRATPDATKAKSTKAKSTGGAATASAAKGVVHHDVGWKQRLPPAGQGTTSASSASSAAKSATSAAAKPASSSSAANSGAVVAPLGPLGTARRIVSREGFAALYKGLTAVYTGIVPKMAIRFLSFEHYRDVLRGWHARYYGDDSGGGVDLGGGTAAPPPQAATFFAGLLSGLTEAVLVVTPAEVCKIRMQSQYHSLVDPTRQTHAKYRNVVQTAALVAKEEGIGALYKGVVPTMLRQGCNQAVNFTAYGYAKRKVLAWKRRRADEEGGLVGVRGGEDDVQLAHWQTLTLGGMSGGLGPLVNNPLDVVKTRMQKQVIHEGKEPKYKGLLQSCVVIAKEEGTPALWKGITPRLMRIMPGQAITFMTYEAVSARLERYGLFR
ncbi:hypothetical protein ACHAWF_003235 [Thalassiosira exigua]